jgi:hypothetical protein
MATEIAPEMPSFKFSLLKYESTVKELRVKNVYPIGRRMNDVPTMII